GARGGTSVGEGGAGGACDSAAPEGAGGFGGGGGAGLFSAGGGGGFNGGGGGGVLVNQGDPPGGGGGSFSASTPSVAESGVRAGNGLVTITTVTATPPDLSLKNEASPSPVVSGNTLTYTLTVTNTGSETANKVRLEDQLPESAVFKSVSTTQGTCIRKVGPPKTPKPKDGGVFCELGSLEGGT